MRRMPVLALGWLLVTGLSAGLLGLVGIAQTPRDLPPTRATLHPARGNSAAAILGFTLSPGAMVGATSCNAASCHGGDLPKDQAGGESHTVADYDPHQKAYQVLFNERSRRMVQLLAQGQWPGTPVIPAHKQTLCLNCHGANPINLASPLSPDSLLHRHGGQCENCHGAAEHWLTLHYTAPWNQLSEAEKAKFGLLPTKNLAYRSMLCAGCHVGEAGREVDHQLIAAGHPALRFELAAYQLEPMYTKHWRDKSYGRDVEAWTWLIGQVGTARAAADLLRHRGNEASVAPPSQPGTAPARDWPELAESSCFACHQDITGVSIAASLGQGRNRRSNAPKLGQVPWGSWPYPVISWLSTASGPPELDWLNLGSRLTPLHDLERCFRESDRPNPALIRDQAHEVVKELDRVLLALQSRARQRSRTEPLHSEELQQALDLILTFAEEIPQSGSAGTDWDRYTQCFLAAAALYRSLCQVEPTTRDPRIEQLLTEIARRLRFPESQDSPSARSRQATNSRGETLAGSEDLPGLWREVRERLRDKVHEKRNRRGINR